jgi:prepilin-type processing-associated H-X9-DG protein
VWSGFQGSYFAQAAKMSLGLAELSCQERLDEVPCHCRSDGPAAHAKDVQVIVLNTLSGREVVVDKRGADTPNLVGTDGRANAAAADGHATLHLPSCDSLSGGDHEVRIVIAIVQEMSAEIGHFMTCRAKLRHQLVL